jgi:hypothetical protein
MNREPNSFYSLCYLKSGTAKNAESATRYGGFEGLGNGMTESANGCGGLGNGMTGSARTIEAVDANRRLTKTTQMGFFTVTLLF